VSWTFEASRKADDSTYQERCANEYAISKNFYALAYDQDEVIDAVSREIGLMSVADPRAHEETKLDSLTIAVIPI
jgi:hypothetical protein